MTTLCARRQLATGTMIRDIYIYMHAAQPCTAYTPSGIIELMEDRGKEEVNRARRRIGESPTVVGRDY